MPVVASVDLTAVLSVIVHLIPMLLLLVRFRQIAELDASATVIPALPAPGAVALADQADRVVSVRITAEGFLVGGTGAGEPFVPRAGEAYDYAGLRLALAQAKELHPQERRVVIVPAGDVPYEVLVDVMDAARSRPVGDGREAELFPVPLVAAPTGGGG